MLLLIVTMKKNVNFQVYCTLEETCNGFNFNPTAIGSCVLVNDISSTARLTGAVGWSLYVPAVKVGPETGKKKQ